MLCVDPFDKPLTNFGAPHPAPHKAARCYPLVRMVLGLDGEWYNLPVTSFMGYSPSQEVSWQVLLALQLAKPEP